MATRLWCMVFVFIDSEHETTPLHYMNTGLKRKSEDAAYLPSAAHAPQTRYCAPSSKIERADAVPASPRLKIYKMIDIDVGTARTPPHGIAKVSMMRLRRCRLSTMMAR